MQGISKDQKASTVARGAGVNILGDILAVAGAPLLYLVVSRALGAEMLGTYVLVTYFISLFFRLSILGFDKGVLRHIPMALAADDPVRAQAATLGTALRYTAGLSVLLALIVAIFPEFFLNFKAEGASIDAAWWLTVLVIALPGQTLCRVALFAIRGLSVMWVFVVVQDVVAPLTLIVLSVAPMAFGLGPYSLVVGFIGSAYISVIVAFVFLKRFFPDHSWLTLLRSERDSALLAFSWPQGLTETLNFLLARVDVIMIAIFFPDRPELVAFYGMASMIAGTVKKVRLAFDNSFSPVMSDLMARGEIDNLRAQYRTVGRWIFGLFVLGCGVIVLASKFILMIYGPEFTAYWIAVPILALGRLFNAAGGTAQAALLMSGRSRLELINNILINVANILLNMILIPRYDVIGAAIATSMSLTLFNVVRIAEVALLLKLSVRLLSAVRVAVSGILAALPGCYLLYRFDSAWFSLAGALLFLVLFPLVLMGVGERKDVEIAWKSLRKGKR